MFFTFGGKCGRPRLFAAGSPAQTREVPSKEAKAA
jgi:hypothetical protein